MLRESCQEVDIVKFFKLIHSGIDVAPLLAEVRAQEEIWRNNTSRQDKIHVQRNTNTIFISAAVRRPELHINENQESRFTDVSRLFPKAVVFLTGIAKEMGAQLSRATIVRLKPRSRVFRHIDSGSYYFIRDRYHLVVSSPAGSVLISGDEQVRMREGELWWFNNKQHHEAYNESDEWRIHYVFDLLPAAYEHLAVNPASLPVESSRCLEFPQESRPANLSLKVLLLSAIRDQAILRGDNRRLIGPNGESYSWLIDTRRIFMQPRVLDAVADLFWDMCAERLPFQIGGMEVAAIPILTAILMKSGARGTPVNGFIVRKERKTYGTGSLIEGTVTDAPIIIVDDILNSGTSLEKVRVILEHENKKIALAFVLIDYHAEKGDTWKLRHRIPVFGAFGLTDFDLAPREAKQPVASTVFQNEWNFTAPDPNFFHRVPKSFPANDGKRVYFGSDCGTFWCLNANDGSLVWKFDVEARGHKNIWSAPALHDGRVFFGSYDGNVYCLDSETGAEVWRFIDADWVGSSPALAPDLGFLFIGLEFAVEGKQGGIVALDLEHGEKVWEHNTKKYTHASPAYCPEQKLVACGSNNNELFLFDAATGVIQWRFETRGASEKGAIRHAPAFDIRREQVITGCANGYIYIVDIRTGKEAWSVRTGNTVYTVPLVVDDTAYIGSTDKYLYVLDLEQRIVKNKVFAGSKIFGPPRLFAGRIYFGACNGIVYEMDPKTAQVTGTHQLPDAITNAVSFNKENGLFYALTYVNQIFAFRRG
jgi:outer membrane protein assembly factor BamB/orotate phosphoribosyltransferase